LGFQDSSKSPLNSALDPFLEVPFEREEGFGAERKKREEREKEKKNGLASLSKAPFYNISLFPFCPHELYKCPLNHSFIFHHLNK